ncbi:MAG: glutathione S-transferase family protein [Asticcacaulis sp.]
MLTLYHSPHTRSSRIIGLIEAMNIRDQVDIRIVDVKRQDGSGKQDPANPHPEGKVPFLVHDGVEIRESSAIILYLTDMFPESRMGFPVGHRLRGAYLSWLSWYGGVVEPVFVHSYLQLDHPALLATFRGMAEVTERLKDALTGQDWLMDGRYTAVDLLVSSPFQWMASLTPDEPAISDWVARCSDQPFQSAVQAFEADALARIRC